MAATKKVLLSKFELLFNNETQIDIEEIARYLFNYFNADEMKEFIDYIQEEKGLTEDEMEYYFDD